MLIDVVMLTVSLGLILLASVVFTNGVELLGKKLNMHQGATGSILAAVGTALPETVIPVIAILMFKDAKAHGVGIGAIAGAPFMLATLAFFVTGAAVYIFAATGRRPRTMTIDTPLLVRDMTFFVVMYGAAILATFFHEIIALKIGVAVCLLLGYVLYVRLTLASEGSEHEETEVLYFSRLFRAKENGFWISVQIAASLVLMVVSAHMFVGYVSDLSFAMGVSALILSMIITPIATELPEKCNSVLWIRQKKDVMALGNITGAMVFQSSFPVAFGIVFTDWDLRGAPMVSAVLAMIAACTVLLWVKVRKTLNPLVLIGCGLLYVAFIIYVSLRN